MSRPTGQLERAIADLTIGVHREKDERHRKLHAIGGKEMTQQFRVPLAGTAGNGWGFVDGPIGFKLPFLWLPAQRGAPFKTPHFSFGWEQTSGTNELVLVHAHVIKWNIDSSSRVVGARVRYSTSAPMVAEAQVVNYSGIVHLTFQGWAGETEEGEVA
jgi:hypothetical protein